MMISTLALLLLVYHTDAFSPSPRYHPLSPRASRTRITNRGSHDNEQQLKFIDNGGNIERGFMSSIREEEHGNKR